MAKSRSRRVRGGAWSVTAILIVTILIVLLRFTEDIGPERSPEDRWTVVRVIDGDTVELLGGDVVRLLGIDTPERGEPLYEEATALLARKTLNQKVRLEYGDSRRDDYGRLLAYLYVDTLLINKVVVDSGMGHLYLFQDNELDSPEINTMLTAQRQAIGHQRGIWSIPYSPESYYIRSQNSFRFHRPGCRMLTSTRPGTHQRFTTREEALMEGLSPCRVCEP